MGLSVAYITPYDANDLTKWSGLGFYISHCIREQGLNLHHVGPLDDPFSLLLALKQRYYRYLHRKVFLRDRTPFILDAYARQISGNISGRDVDIVFSPTPVPVSHLACEQPIVIWTDAVFEAMLDFYPDYSRVCRESVRDAIALEKNAFQRAARIIFSSEWAARAAEDFYNIDLSKISVIPFGANIEWEMNLAEIKQILHSRDMHPCRLLFMGVEWHRKGGEVAFQVATELNRNGLETVLTVIGCQPPSEVAAIPYVRTIGFLNKKDRADLKRLHQELAHNHFLILPTRADCTPVVFSEANAFALPCISTLCGGIPSIITDDVNGKLFPLDGSPDAICGYIMNTFSDRRRYTELALSSFQEYQNRLNWKASGRKVKALLEALA